MRATNVGLTIVLVVAIGGAVAWLWSDRKMAPVTGNAVELRPVASQAPALPKMPGSSRSQPDMHPEESSERPKSVPPAASVTPRSVNANGTTRDESTYYRMLAIAQSLPKLANVARNITEMHESFVLTPDDPDWGRRTEQALRDLFQAQSADGGLEITSISCRSAGCEVQAQGRPMQGFVDTQSADGQGEPSRERPSAASLLDDWPVGQSLRKEAVIGLDLGDRTGFFVKYRRLGSKLEVSSP